jgi:transcriptional regulator with XRE-family HTH domain
MNAASLLKTSRRRAGLSQRQLAAAVGMPQPVVARIESGAGVPRVDTLSRLLAGCGERLESRPRLGVGLDRSVIRRLMRLSPGERARLAVEEARHLDRLDPPRRSRGRRA